MTLIRGILEEIKKELLKGEFSEKELRSMPYDVQFQEFIKKMQRKNKNNNLIKMSELAKVSGVRYSTISWYSQIGILPYFQKGKRLVRRYDVALSIKRLREIRKLKSKGKSIVEIKKHFTK